MGTKTGSPWGALSPKPAGLLSQVCCFSVPGRAKEGRSCLPLIGQPERPIGSCSGRHRPALAPAGPPFYPPADSTLPPLGKSSVPLRAPPGGLLPWPLAGARQEAKASSNVHATAASLRSIPPTTPGTGLAVPSPGGGRASRAAVAAAAAAAPPLWSTQLDPHLGRLLLAESWPARGIPFFYPRQSPPSRQCIKPFRPERPGTSMRESSGEGPLPPGPPPALCSARRGTGNTRALTRAHSIRTRTATHTHTQSHTLLTVTQTDSLTRSITRVYTHSSVAYTFVHSTLTHT